MLARMQPGKLNKCGVLVTGFGAFLAIGGGLLALFWPAIFDKIVDKQMEIRPDAQTFEDWKKPSIPLYFDVYFFNWTNPEEFSNQTVKPRFVEVGPYRFREEKEKVNITFHPENATVGYKIKSYWYFEESLSNGSLDDTITMLNVIAASAAYRARNWMSFRQSFISMGFNMYEQKLVVRKSVRELLFDGYSDPLLDMSKDLPSSFTDDAPKVDRFGWFYGRNGSAENSGHLNVATGVDGQQPGEIKLWNFLEKLKDEQGKCAELNGSTGEFFPRKMSPNDDLYLFSPDLCRTVPLQYEQNTLVNGVDVMRFVAGDKAVDNGTIYPENKCYCPDNDCPPSGVLDLSKCRFGSPTFVSFPHFYGADPFYRDAIEGMKPDKDKHSFFIALEPNFGIPLEVAARFQINILVQPNPSISLYANIPKTYIPVLWFEQRVAMPQKISDDLSGAAKMSPLGCIFAICIAVTGVIVASIAPLTSYKNRRKREHLEKRLPLEEAAVPLKGIKPAKI